MEGKIVKKKDDLDKYFEDFLSKNSIFKDKSVFDESFTPEEILHREEYLGNIAKILAPSLKNQKPSNMFIYGKCGTGKTLCVGHVISKIKEIAFEKEIGLKIIKINCKLKKVADTEYRILLEILKFFGKEYPMTGYSTNDLYKEMYKSFDEKKFRIILLLDEIDSLIIKTGDEILYNFVRINSELKKSSVSLIGITNDLTIMDNVDSRVKSSLNEEEIVFLPYNAIQIEDILKKRANLGFIENSIDNEVISRAAALAAREHGDARRALELLRFAGELAQRENCEKVSLEHMIQADKKTERNRIIDIIKSQPKQFQLVLYSIIKTSFKEKLNLITNKKNLEVEPTTTGAVYDYYNKLAKELKQTNLSLRRISDIIVELEVLGIINFKIVSKGRYGRTRYITMGLPKTLFDVVLKILKTDLNLV